MIVIYTIPVSLYCAKLRIVLREKELEWQEILPPGGYGSKEYKAIVPAGNLPAMQDGELLIADSEAAAEYLNEKFPDPPMLPADLEARALARSLSRFHDTRLEPALRACFPFIVSGTTNAEARETQLQQVELRLGQLDQLLQNIAVQDIPLRKEAALLLGDCGYPITLTWISVLAQHFNREIPLPENVEAYRKEIMGHMSVADECLDYTPKLTTWLREQTS